MFMKAASAKSPKYSPTLSPAGESQGSGACALSDSAAVGSVSYAELKTAIPIAGVSSSQSRSRKARSLRGAASPGTGG